MSNGDNFRAPVEWASVFAGSFEAELLLELLLRHWNHPLADDSEFRNSLMECAADVLIASSNGEELIDGIPPQEMNFVSAVWFVEATSQHEEHATERQAWSDRVRRAIPSCFCSQDRLL